MGDKFEHSPDNSPDKALDAIISLRDREFLAGRGMIIGDAKTVGGEKQWPISFKDTVLDPVLTTSDGRKFPLGKDWKGVITADTVKIEYMVEKTPGGKVTVSSTDSAGKVDRTEFRNKTEPMQLYNGLGSSMETFNTVNSKYQSFNDQDLGQIDRQLSLYEGGWIDKLPDSEKGEAFRQKAHCLAQKIKAEVIKLVMMEPVSGAGGHAFAASLFTIVGRLRNPKSSEENKRFVDLLLKCKKELDLALRYLPDSSEGRKKAMILKEQIVAPFETALNQAKVP